MNKIARFFEEHVEKMVLVVVGLVCAWLLITRVIFSPNMVEVGDRKLSPGISTITSTKRPTHFGRE